MIRLWVLAAFFLVSAKYSVRIHPNKPVLKMLTNEDQTLTCKKVGNSEDNVTTTFKWIVSGQTVSASDTYNVSGRTARSGNITCTLVDSSGNILNSASICVDIQFSAPPETVGEKNVTEGRSANICLPIKSNPLPDMYNWTKTGLKSSWKTTDRCPLLDSVKRSDAGEYRLKVFNTITSVRGSQRSVFGYQFVKLNVLYVPTVTCSSEVNVDQGSSVILNCRADASPPAHQFGWTLNTTILTSGPHPHYNITNAQLSDIGVYVCEATNTMTDYSGETVTGKGECRITVTLNEQPAPLSALWMSYKIYVIGGTVAVFILALSVTIAIVIARRSSSRKENITSKKAPSSKVGNEKPCTDTMSTQYNRDYPDANDSYSSDSVEWTEEQPYGNVSPGDWQRCGNAHLQVQPDLQYDGNVYTEDPPKCSQHYGNVTFEPDVYENVAVGHTEQSCYENTVF